MSKQPRRLRRCQLAVPGSSDKMMTKAASLDVDHVFFDLEDAVAPNAKVGARDQIVNALNTLDFGKTVRCVRINDLDTHYAYEDIITIVEGAGEKLDTILVPKVRNACDVRFVDRLLTQIEIKLGPALETIAALAEQGARFDLVFIDADKTNYSEYFDAVLPLLPIGGLILADNTLWSGKVIDPQADSDHALVAYNKKVRDDPRVEQVLLSVRDGVMLARKIA